MRTLRWTCFSLLLACAGALGAQTIRGSVVLPDSVSPVAGVLIVGLDRAGAQAARTVSGLNGAFTLRLPAAGTYRLQVLRIGYTPVPGPELAVAAGETQTARIVYASTAVTLSAMNVRDRQTCRVTADTGLGVARVWEEARKAMLFSQTTAADAPLIAEWIEYDRSLDSAARVVKTQRVRTTRAPTTHAFRAVSLAQLDTGGYVAIDASGTSYFAPDAEVLLSDVFIRGHCFRLDDSRRSEGLLGVRFEPAPERRDKREIVGTMWLDRNSAELRDVDFGYTNLPDIALPVAGGKVEFMHIGEGAWLVRRWRLTMPRVERAPTKSGDALRRTIYAVNGLHITAVQVAGGEVTQVRRGDSVVYVGVGPRVAVQLVAREKDMPVGGASIRLEGTDYSDIADADGRAMITPVLAGRYRAVVTTPLMAAVGMPSLTREIEARTGDAVDTLMLPRASEVLTAACPRDSVRNGEGMLHGFVHDASGRAVAGAAVTVTWQENFAIEMMADGNRLQHDNRVIGSLTRDDGRWQACGVPRDRLLVVEVATDSGADKQKERLDQNQPFRMVDLILHPVTSKAAQEAWTAIDAGDRPKAVVEFTVIGARGEVLPNTVLDIADASGMRRTITTGPGGKGLAAAMTPGDLSIITRRIGYAPGKLTAKIGPGRNTVPIILNENAAPTLDTVRVVAGQRLYGIQRNDEFEQRRAMKLATVSYNREDIQKRNPTDISDMLLGVPSLQLRTTDKYGGLVAMSSRSMDITPSGELKNCYITVMVDGVIKNPRGEPFDLRLLPPPGDIHGIEVFAGGASIPVQYGGVGSDKWCGLIAVWTR